MTTPFLESHAIVISTLSPVHIGCGEDYEPTNYVIDNKQLLAFDPAQLLKQLTTQDKSELLRALDGPDPLPATQRFFYRHRAVAEQVASHRVPVAKAIAEFYQSRFGKVVQRESAGKKVINRLEIARTTFNPVDQLPYLPGSSLKGAMRTAILEGLRKKNDPDRFPLDQPGNSRLSGQVAKSMEQTLLGGSFHTDPLRLVKISDAPFQPGHYPVQNAAGEKQLRTREARRICFQVNRKKRPNQFSAQGNVNTLIECIPAGQPRAFLASLVFEHKQSPKVDQLPHRQLTFAELAQMCNDFYLPAFEQECAILEKNGYVAENWLKNARTRLKPEGLWGKAISAGRGFLLRVGRHSGAECVTVDAPRQIKILRGKGTNPDYLPNATTLWLAADDKDAHQGMQPFGWVFVQLR